MPLKSVEHLLPFWFRNEFTIEYYQIYNQKLLKL